MLFTASIILYVFVFIALPAYNQLNRDEQLKEKLRQYINSGQTISLKEIFYTQDDQAALNMNRPNFFTSVSLGIGLGILLIIMISAYIIFKPLFQNCQLMRVPLVFGCIENAFFPYCISIYRKFGF